MGYIIYGRVSISGKNHQCSLQAWLGKAANCPLCRCELPTDDPEWEEMRRQKKRKEKKEQDLEALHDSMFG